jgi:hypothetical protein
MKGMRFLSFLLLLAAALPAQAQSMVDDPMIRWDCNPEGQQLRLEMVQPPVGELNERELIVFNGMVNFVQCKIGGANWTLLVDLVEYDAGRCSVDPDTIVSLLRNEQLVIARTVIGYNCGDRPVLSAARIVESKDEGARLELCTAAKYGEPHRCSPFQINGEAIDNNTVAAHARGP